MKRGRVKKMLFDDLVESIKEAGKIHRGEMPPSRKFVFEAMDKKAIRKGLGKSQIEELDDRMHVVTLRSQIATLKPGRGRHRKYLSHVFTEQGVAMLSTVLNSERAVQVNISIMRAFVALRRAAASHAALSRRLDELERKHGVHDEKLKIVFNAIRDLMEIPMSPRRRIGF